MGTLIADDVLDGVLTEVRALDAHLTETTEWHNLKGEIEKSAPRAEVDGW